jgi:hypothetical protein
MTLRRSMRQSDCAWGRRFSRSLKSRFYRIDVRMSYLTSRLIMEMPF